MIEMQVDVCISYGLFCGMHQLVSYLLLLYLYILWTNDIYTNVHEIDRLLT